MVCVTTISRRRKRLWPSGLQYNARHMQIAWPSMSLCTGILAGRCSSICRRQRTKMRKENTQMPGSLIMCFAGRDQHMQVHHRECFSMSREAKSSFSAWQRTFSAWQRTIFTMRAPYHCQRTLPATLNRAHRTTPRMSAAARPHSRSMPPPRPRPGRRRQRPWRPAYMVNTRLIFCANAGTCTATIAGYTTRPLLPCAIKINPRTRSAPAHATRSERESVVYWYSI